MSPGIKAVWQSAECVQLLYLVTSADPECDVTTDYWNAILLMALDNKTAGWVTCSTSYSNCLLMCDSVTRVSPAAYQLCATGVLAACLCYATCSLVGSILGETEFSFLVIFPHCNPNPTLALT